MQIASSCVTISKFIGHHVQDCVRRTAVTGALRALANGRIAALLIGDGQLNRDLEAEDGWEDGPSSLKWA